ncbi:MAG: PorP/SprF family type IX secretion system membrane protein [Bacteroidota bacterium]
MKKSIFTISTFFALASSVVYAQQEKLLTHFIYDKMSINPGSTGLEQGIGATMVYRNQWDKVNGAPNSVLFNAEANLDQVFHGGAGISFYHDAIGEMRQNNLLLNYSFPVRFQNVGTLGIGIGLGLVNVGFDPAWIPPVTINDPLLPIAKAGSNMDLNFGLYWKGQKPYYVGFSMTHLTQADIKNVNYTNARHMFLIGGYTFMNVFGDGRSLDLQMLTRTDMVKYSAEINARYLHQLNKKVQLYGGLTARVSDGLGFMLGMVKNINDKGDSFTAGYSYDLTLNKLSNISKGSHEFVLRYIKQIPPPPVEKSKHPRWL